MRSQLWQAVASLVVGVGLLTVGCSSGSSTGGVLPDPNNLTMLDVQAQVFAPRCGTSGCHAGTTPPFGLDLASLTASQANLVGVASAEVPAFQRIEPGNFVDSYLYMKVIGDPRIQGDQMPASGGPLTAGQLFLLEQWIEQGAR